MDPPGTAGTGDTVTVGGPERRMVSETEALLLSRSCARMVAVPPAALAGTVTVLEKLPALVVTAAPPESTVAETPCMKLSVMGWLTANPVPVTTTVENGALLEGVTPTRVICGRTSKGNVAVVLLMSTALMSPGPVAALTGIVAARLKAPPTLLVVVWPSVVTTPLASVNATVTVGVKVGVATAK
jgi:hypothetical protein